MANVLERGWEVDHGHSGFLQEHGDRQGVGCVLPCRTLIKTWILGFFAEERLSGVTIAKNLPCVREPFFLYSHCIMTWPFAFHRYLINNFSEFQLASVGSFIIHEGVFFLSGLPYLFMEMWGLKKYKIQGKMNTPAAQEKCITRLLLYHTCVNLPLMMLAYPMFRWMGMTSKLPLPSWKVVAFQIISYFILEDFIFYWGHRILHTKWLYKHVHSVHHEYATPFGLTSEYAHPAEILFLGFATFFGPGITGPHLFTLWLWMILRVLETVEAHCGYDFPWSLSKLFPIYGGADFHDYHHRLLYTKSGNYSSTFTYMDWIFGTDKGYHKLKSLKQGTEVSEEFLVRTLLETSEEYEAKN